MSVPLSTIKSALKIEYDDDDIELTRLREAAQSLIERRTGLALTLRTSTLYLAAFTDMVIPEYPFVSATSVTYTDTAGASQTMATADYWVDKTDGPMPLLRFLTAYGINPGTAVTFTYQSGYDALPPEITHAVIALVGAWYNNPEALQPTMLTTVPMSLEYIIDSMSVRSLIR
jgi:uncharacterized phiE125 gp8 family phage protein